MKHFGEKGTIDWFFKDKHHKWAVIQWPNVLLWAWILLSVLVFFVHDSTLRDHITLLKNAVLFAWAYMEAVDGDSYFRRVFGVVVLCSTLVSFLY